MRVDHDLRKYEVYNVKTGAAIEVFPWHDNDKRKRRAAKNNAKKLLAALNSEPR